MNRSINTLHGLGPKKVKILKEFNIHSLYNLLHHFPRNYIDKSQKQVFFLEEGQLISVYGTIYSKGKKYARKPILEAILSVDEPPCTFTLVFFRGLTYFDKMLEVGGQGIFSGKLKKFGSRWQIVHPDFEILDKKGNSSVNDFIHVGRIVPLYPSTDAGRKVGLDSRGFRKFLFQIINMPDFYLPEIIPQSLKEKYHLLDRMEAYKEIHFPTSMEKIQVARKRLVFEEFFLYHMMMRIKKNENSVNHRLIHLKENTKNKFRIQFPFTLTKDQSDGIKQILSLTDKPSPYAVLLQGDVGSGKTAVVLAIASKYINSGLQVALMAPTEILAKQHFLKLSSYLENFLLPIDILVGKEKIKIKKETLLNIASGQTKFIVGTHALIQDTIKFANLGLIIIDEQHRFGVKQRESLRLKGKNPDLIALTATPIPRTLAMSLFGNLETVYLRQKPAGRFDVDTRWFYENRLESIYRGVIKYVSQGQQAFIVYPMIKESEKIDLNACVDNYKLLKSSTFRDYNCGLLHGKMSSDEKSDVMQKFQNENIQILFTTTVIEVGIDIPNATVMIIQNAERFGLSTLHQLRGRVGRSNLKGFCILVSSSEITDNGKKRLQALVDSNDGFHLADVDLRLRGPGELLGLKQSGLPDFKIADFTTDSKICLDAYNAANNNISETKIKSIEDEIKQRFSGYQSLFS